MSELQFLERIIFKGLKNYNNGYDPAPLHHFCPYEFVEVMNRAEKYGVTILGIERWENKELQKATYFEDYRSNASEKNWHRLGYNNIVTEPMDAFVLSATFDVPAEYLTDLSGQDKTSDAERNAISY
jgi:hypothetical protein